jgi:predicted transcriptional regulator of viral defense system
MPRRSTLSIAQPQISDYIHSSQKRVYSWTELAQVLTDKRRLWNLAEHTTTPEFVSFLEKQAILKSRTFQSQAYNRNITRYCWGDPSIYEAALALYSRGYLSHIGALAVHKLIEINPKALYLNVEQSLKTSFRSVLAQHAIDQAFSRKQRQSNLIYHQGDWTVTIINGKNTDRLEVEATSGPQGEMLQVTSLERTLVDVTVRPSYAGGIDRVIDAFKAAKHRASTDRLIDVLRKLDYAYPYHQSVGFLMERAGYAEGQFSPLHRLSVSHKFYLDYGISNPAFDEKWQIFYPTGLTS